MSSQTERRAEALVDSKVSTDRIVTVTQIPGGTIDVPYRSDMTVTDACKAAEFEPRNTNEIRVNKAKVGKEYVLKPGDSILLADPIEGN